MSRAATPAVLQVTSTCTNPSAKSCRGHAVHRQQPVGREIRSGAPSRAPSKERVAGPTLHLWVPSSPGSSGSSFKAAASIADLGGVPSAGEGDDPPARPVSYSPRLARPLRQRRPLQSPQLPGVPARSGAAPRPGGHCARAHAPQRSARAWWGTAATSRPRF